MRKDGLFPQAYSGGRAVVFPVEISNKKYALKCWIQALGALEERYKAISTLIHKYKPAYLIESVYRENEILFNGRRYPVLQMQWSESLTFKEWISANISEPRKIHHLANKFLEIVTDMHRIGMSHGDLQHENILVDPTLSITLVDYDSIYLPGLDHLDDEVKGLPGYQHSSRALQVKANPKSDYLSEYVIYITLVALSKKPELWSSFKDHNRLLFSQEDLLRPSSSNIFQTLRGLDDVSELADALETQCLCRNLGDIVPIEQILSAVDTPSPQKDLNEVGHRSKENPQQVATRAKPSDLRKARTWNGSNNAGNSWPFGPPDSTVQNRKDFDNSYQEQSKPQSQETFTSSSAGKSSHPTSNASSGNPFASQSVSKANSQDWPSIMTPQCLIESSLYSSKNTKQVLISISFERTFLRFNCVSEDGKKSQLSISKQRFIGWRRHNLRLELVAKDSIGTGVVTVSTELASSIGCIDQIENQLVSAGISADNNLRSQTSKRAANAENIPQMTSDNAIPSNDKSSESNFEFHNISYSSDAAIATATGQSLLNVKNAAAALGFTSPFTSVERYQIILRLKKGFSSSSHSGNSKSSQTLDTLATKSQSSVVADQSNESASAASVSEWKFAYTTIADIARCTGKSLADVRTAAKILGVNPPFTLIEADRIAGKLVGDPSIRRAYDKLEVTQSLSSSESSSDCFVATVVYGDPCHPDLVVLRSYRDQVLMSSLFGRAFVYCYYRIGPGLAFLIGKARLRLILLPFLSLFVRSLPSFK